MRQTLADDCVRTLYEDHAGPLLGYVHRLIGDQQRAEDVVQETMLRAWLNPEAAGPAHGSLRPWLLTVARNIVIDQARARKSRPPEVQEQPPFVADNAEGPGVDEGLDALALQQDVVAAIRTLSQPHRAVLVEVYYRDRTVIEAAETLGIPPGTVKSRTYYALHLLELALEGQGITASRTATGATTS